MKADIEHQIYGPIDLEGIQHYNRVLWANFSKAHMGMDGRNYLLGNHLFCVSELLYLFVILDFARVFPPEKPKDEYDNYSMDAIFALHYIN